MFQNRILWYFIKAVNIAVNYPSLNNIALKRVNYSNFLGVIIDDGLK